MEKKKHRSPNYPYLDLEEAVERLRLIYTQDKRSPTSASAMLEHMGYSTRGKEGKSGAGGRALSALRQYGLIDEESGHFRVSDSGFRLLVLDPDTPEWLELISKAAGKPTLFSKLLTHFSFDLPSDTTLRSHLILSESFNPDSVQTFIRTFRKTIEFAKLTDEDYVREISEKQNVIDGEFVDVLDIPEQPQPAYRASVDPSIRYGGNMILDRPDHVFSYQLSFPRNIRAEVRIFGNDLRKQDIERLKKEVGDLAGAFDEDSTDSTGSSSREVEPTQ